MDPKRHNELTGIGNEQILQNLKELLKRRYNVKVRMPMLKGINDSREEIDQVIQFLLPFRDDPNFKGVDLLPYHKMGVGKYAQLDKPCDRPPPAGRGAALPSAGGKSGETKRDSGRAV